MVLSDGATPFHIAAGLADAKENTRFTKLMLEYGGNPNIRYYLLNLEKIDSKINLQGTFFCGFISFFMGFSYEINTSLLNFRPSYVNVPLNIYDIHVYTGNELCLRDSIEFTSFKWQI